MEGLLRRGTTAFFFVAAMLLGVFVNRYTFLLLFLIITLLCLWEFYQMTLPKRGLGSRLRLFCALTLGVLPFISTAYWQVFKTSAVDLSGSQLLVLNVLPAFILFIPELFSKSEQPFTNIALSLMGWIYIGLPFALLNFIAFHDGQYWKWTIFALIGINWANDSGAYLSGSLLGKTPLFPRISPKKSWEGALGGLLFALALSWVAKELPDSEFNLKGWILISFIIVVFGSLGDLIESMLKRSKHTKDSGSLLPGHGGFLDRFDAFIFLIPFAAVCMFWLRSI